MIDLDQFIFELQEDCNLPLDVKDPQIEKHVTLTTLRFAVAHFHDLRTWEDGQCVYDLSDIKEELLKHGFLQKEAKFIQNIINSYFNDIYLQGGM